MTGQAQAGAAASDTQALVRGLGIEVEESLLDLALTHRSYAHEAGGIPTNERLEFLGDAVLGIIITEYLFRKYTGTAEGDLAKMRAAVVSQRGLAVVARQLNLGKYILLGRGEVVTGGHDKDSILADALEAVIGAVFLTHGLEPTRTMVEKLTAPLLVDARRLGASLDWKTSLVELANNHHLPQPSYAVEASGPDHDRTFDATATVGSYQGRGTGSSKKTAEHLAAEDVYHQISAAFEGGA